MHGCTSTTKRVTESTELTKLFQVDFMLILGSDAEILITLREQVQLPTFYGVNEYNDVKWVTSLW